MLRIILGIIAGYIIWSVLWVGSEAVFSVLSADWGKTLNDFQEAVGNHTPYTLSSSIMIILLIKSFIISIISGFVCALIAGENTKSTIILGILLLLSGIFVQAMHWNYMALWYHVLFLLSLIPMTVLGGKLAKR